MPDATYDVVMVGGGTKNLVLACYLAKYGGLKVAMFERRNEIGGGLASEECAAPGFITNTHGTSVHDFYTLTTEWDFPELEEYLTVVPYRIARGMVYTDGTGVSLHNLHYDPHQEATAKSIARISEKDAETYLNIYEQYYELVRPAMLEYAFNPPTPEGVPGALEKLMANPANHWDFDKKTGIGDPSWGVKSALEVFREIFDSEKIIAGMLRLGHSGHGQDPESPATGFNCLFNLLFKQIDQSCFQGGSHMAAHALHKIALHEGVHSFTRHPVEKVLIENGKATGIQLEDGTQIKAKVAVVSGMDPLGIIRHCGEEHFPTHMVRKIKNLIRWHTCITWYFWAVNERPRYYAEEFDPDVHEAGWLAVGQDDIEYLSRSVCWRRLGQFSPYLNLVVSQNSLVDPTQAPEGKHILLSEDFVLPATALSEREWLEYKKDHGNAVIDFWQKFAPNMTWDNVIDYTPQTPYDIAKRLVNMGPEGNWAIIDQTPSQAGRNRPIAEWAQHRIKPIENLYGCGSAWHPWTGGMMVCHGYNAYKVLCEDHPELDMRKPWEEDGRPF